MARLGMAKRGPALGGGAIARQPAHRRGGEGEEDDRGEHRAPRPLPRPTAMMPAPTVAPARPPTDQKPWKNDMVGLPRSASSSEAWVFIDTSSAAIDAPRRKQATKKSGTVGATIGSGIRTAKAKLVTAVGRRDPVRAMTAPVTGMKITAPIGQRQKREAEHRRIDVEARLDQRNVHRPDAGAGAEDEEGDRNGDAGPDEAVETRRGGCDLHRAQILTRVPTAATMSPAVPARPSATAMLRCWPTKPRSGGAIRKPP